MQAINHIRIENNKAYVVGRGYLKAEMVARMHVDEHASIEAVMAQYDLTVAEVYACLAYYYDHQDVLEQDLDAKLAEIEANATPSRQYLEEIKARPASSIPPSE
jgi:uncharacterized protein (DUF433 family)